MLGFVAKKKKTEIVNWSFKSLPFNFLLIEEQEKQSPDTDTWGRACVVW